jgi:hypothetical protein
MPSPFLVFVTPCLASQDYMAPEVLVCPDKRRPEENKDKVLLAYTAQVRSVDGGLCEVQGGWGVCLCVSV